MTSQEKSKLTHIADELLKSRLPEDVEGYPTRISKTALRAIEQHNENLRKLTCDLIDLRDGTSLEKSHCLACGGDQIE